MSYKNKNTDFLRTEPLPGEDKKELDYLRRRAMELEKTLFYSEVKTICLDILIDVGEKGPDIIQRKGLVPDKSAHRKKVSKQ